MKKTDLIEKVRNATQQYYNHEQVIELLSALSEKPTPAPAQTPDKPLTLF
jgi:hypothetical protein